MSTHIFLRALNEIHTNYTMYTVSIIRNQTELSWDHRFSIMTVLRLINNLDQYYKSGPPLQNEHLLHIAYNGLFALI